MRPARVTRACQRIVYSPVFTGFVFAVIVANAIVLGAQTYDAAKRERGALLETLNEVFLAIFVVELALRVGAYGSRPQDFFRSGWNVFDFIVVAAAFAPGLRENSTLLRLARLMRVVRLVRLLPDLRVLLVAVGRSIPPLFSMSVLTLLIIFVFGMVGWTLFGDADPDHWGDIGKAMLNLFVMLSLENLPENLERGTAIHPWSWVYFVSFALIAAFIVLNVLIGVVLNSMEEARALERERTLSSAFDEPHGPGDEPREAVVAERIALIREAIDELEDELRPGGGGRHPPR
jgi:voltage-gated sodium channel